MGFKVDKKGVLIKKAHPTHVHQGMKADPKFYRHHFGSKFLYRSKSIAAIKIAVPSYIQPLSEVLVLKSLDEDAHATLLDIP